MRRSRDSRVEFRRDPLLFLDQNFACHDGIMRLPGGELCVADPADAKAILGNLGDRYYDHSDFFHTARGIFGPREAQVEIGRQGRRLVRAHVTARAGSLGDLVHCRLAPVSDWPDAGNLLVYEHLRTALLGDHRPPRLRATVDRVVALAVLATARERRRPLARTVLRYQVIRELTTAVAASRALRDAESSDLLDVIVRAAPGAPDADVAEVFLSFLFAIAGSIGFALGWSLYLTGTAASQAPPSFVVREALRLWPVAWMFGRRPAHPHEIAGVPVTKRDRVTVCTYLVHRHPDHWDHADNFAPHRWSEPNTGHAFMPFGYGPHACTGASVTLELVAELLRIITQAYRPSITVHRSRPHIGPALAPPPFTLHLR